MAPGSLLALAFVVVVLGGVFYWIFVAPGQARRQRRDALHSDLARTHTQAWDPNIGARKRER